MSEETPPFQKSALCGRRVHLRPLAPQDYEFVRELEMGNPQSFIRFRHRGRTPSPEEFAASLWQGVLDHFVIVENETGRRCGTAVCYGADHRNGYAYIAAAIATDLQGQGWPLEGLGLLVDYLFAEFRFRKLYGESLAPNAAPFASALGRTVEVEACLRAHEYIHGEFVDKYVIAIYPGLNAEPRRERAKRFVAAIRGDDRRVDFPPAGLVQTAEPSVAARG